MVPFLWRRGAKREPGGAKHQERVVRSTSDNRWLEPTTPSAPAKEASRHFLSGRSHPSLSKEGTSAFSSVVFNAPVSSKRCGTWQDTAEGPGGDQPGPRNGNFVPRCKGHKRLRRVTCPGNLWSCWLQRWHLTPV